MNNNNNNSTRRRRDLPTTRPSSPGRYSPGARTNDVPPDPEEEEEGPCRECEEGSDGCVGEGEEEEERTTAPLNPTEYEPIPMETLVPSVVSGDENGDVNGDVDVDVDANISVNAHANANANVNASVDFNVNVDVDVDIGEDLVDYDYDEIRYRLLQEEEDDRREWLEHHIFARDDVPGDSDEDGDGDAFNDRSWEFHDEQMRLFWEEYPDEYDDDDEHDHYNGNGDHNDDDNDDDNDDERWHGHGYSMVEQQQQQQQQQLPPVSQSSQLRGDVVGNDSDSDHHEDDLWSFPNELLREPQMKALVEECETRDKAATTGRSNSGARARARARARDNNNNNGNYDNNIDNDDGDDNDDDNDDNDDDDDDCPPSWTSRCVVCLEQSATHAMVPCGHLCLCAECTVRSFSKAICGTPSCPVCRQPLSMVLRIFVP